MPVRPRLPMIMISKFPSFAVIIIPSAGDIPVDSMVWGVIPSSCIRALAFDKAFSDNVFNLSDTGGCYSRAPVSKIIDSNVTSGGPALAISMAASTAFIEYLEPSVSSW